MKDQGILVIVSGFSGAGKGTVMKKLLSTYGDRYSLSVSATTRSPRPGETDGKEYFFKTREEFEAMIADDAFIEYASYVNNYYGTPKKYVQDCMAAGKDVILEIEQQGAMKVKEKFPDVLLIFVVAPSMKELEERLRNRQTESEEVIRGRMRQAAVEAGVIDKYDVVLVNDDLDTCVEELHNIIQSTKAATARRADFIKLLQKESEAYL